MKIRVLTFTKVSNTWIVENGVATNVEGGANDHEARPSGVNQDEKDVSDL